MNAAAPHTRRSSVWSGRCYITVSVTVVVRDALSEVAVRMIGSVPAGVPEAMMN